MHGPRRRATGHSGPIAPVSPPCPGTPSSWLVLVMPLGNVGFAGGEGLAEKFVDPLLGGAVLLFVLHKLGLEFHPRFLRQVHRLGRSENAVLVDGSDGQDFTSTPCPVPEHSPAAHTANSV